MDDNKNKVGKDKKGNDKPKKNKKEKIEKDGPSQRRSEDDLDKYADLFYYDGKEDEGQSISKIFKSESRIHLSKEQKKKRVDLIRSLVAFWLLGFTNNFGYSFILSAALDILEKIQGPQEKGEKIKLPDQRDCNAQSAGTVLLTVSLPGLILKMILPFLPLCIKIRFGIMVIMNVVGFLLVGFVENYLVIMLGLIMVSMASEIGESSFLQFATYFTKFVIPAWSSGTGAAGFVGALSFASIMSLFGFRVAILTFLTTPLIMVIGFLVLPKIDPANSQFILDSRPKASSVNLVKKKMKVIPTIIDIVCCYGLSYLFMYLGTQGLFDIIFFENVELDHNSQYRWYSAIYQFGNFLARTTGPYWGVTKVWIFPSAVIVAYFLCLFETIFLFTPWIYIVLFFVFVYGILSGGAYVVTYLYVKLYVKSENKQFTTTICTVAGSIGILSAGGIAIPIHNAICKMKKPNRLSF